MKGPSVKRQIITFMRILRNGFQNLFRNAWLTTAAIAIMVVTLTIVLGALIANLILQETIDDVSTELTISVFINDDATEDKERALIRTLEDNDNVTAITYKSKQAALGEFQDRFPDLQDGVAITDGNPFPASYEVTLANIDRYQEVIDIAQSAQFDDIVQNTSDNEQSRQAFTGFINTRKFINQASIVAGGIFGAISMLVIFNTIRMAIFTRSDEIEIMKLIGARPSYIRGPFLFEASLYGVIAGLITISVVYSALIGLSDRLGSGIKMDRTLEIFTEQWSWVFLAVIGTGVAIGFLSSSIAMAKYLRIKRW